MGISHRYELEKNDKKKFVTAAIGYSYPYSKFRHFFHQPDMTKKIFDSHYGFIHPIMWEELKKIASE